MSFSEFPPRSTRSRSVGDERSSCGRAGLRSWATFPLAGTAGPWAGATRGLQLWAACPSPRPSTGLCPGRLVPRSRLQPLSASSQASTTRQRPSCWTAGGSSWSSGEWGLRGRGRGRGWGSSTSEVFPGPRKLSDLSQTSLKRQEGVLCTFRVEWPLKEMLRENGMDSAPLGRHRKVRGCLF